MPFYGRYLKVGDELGNIFVMREKFLERLEASKPEKLKRD